MSMSLTRVPKIERIMVALDLLHGTYAPVTPIIQASPAMWSEGTIKQSGGPPPKQ